MKREILRIQEMNYAGESGRGLDFVSLYLLEGEITGFAGLAGSGKELLVNILLGEQKYDSGIVSVCGRRIVNSEELADTVYRLVDSNYRIEDWTAAEYIGLVGNQSIFGMLRKKRLVREIQSLFDELCLGIDPQKRLRELNELEKRLVDVAKAYYRKAKILVIEDEFEGFAAEEIVRFKKELKRLIHGSMTVVINNHSDMVTSILAERLIIFKRGRIVKKCRRDEVKDVRYLETFMLGTSIRTKKHSLDRLNVETNGEKERIYRVDHVMTEKGHELSFLFHRGEVVTILALNRKEKEHVFAVLSGRGYKEGVIRILGEEVCDFQDIADCVRSGIVSVAHLGDMEELLPSMSVGENLLVPSLNKLSSIEYTMAEHRLVKMLEKEIGQSGVESEDRIRTLGINDRIVLTMERWHVYNPRVMILLEPFVQCDAYGVSLVKSYIKKIAAAGTCVVVIKSREEYMEEITDRFVGI